MGRHTYIYIQIYTYVHIYRERDRDRSMIRFVCFSFLSPSLSLSLSLRMYLKNMHKYILYIYYIHIYIYMKCSQMSPLYVWMVDWLRNSYIPRIRDGVCTAIFQKCIGNTSHDAWLLGGSSETTTQQGRLRVRSTIACMAIWTKIGQALPVVISNDTQLCIALWCLPGYRLCWTDEVAIAFD